MKKKLQIFVSSTYVDLQDERQAAVEGILSSNNIPAGMELFKAGNRSQWDTIKKWINDSDIYMLILGGRYGSIEPLSGKSYTQLEYEYAVEQGIPVFATVLSETFLREKASTGEKVYETENRHLYDQFKKMVMSRMVKMVDDCKDIVIAIHASIADLKEDYDFDGWIRGVSNETFKQLSEQNAILLKENNELKTQIKEKEDAANQDIVIKEEFWERKYSLNVEGYREFMGTTYRKVLQMSMREIFVSLAPLMMVSQRIDVLKNEFENALQEKYEPTVYSLSLQDNQFQSIKVQIFSMKLIKLSVDKDQKEIISLSELGVSALCDFEN